MEDVRKIQHSFYNISGFPGVLGAIDGTHIRIQSPGGANAEVYRNRKGYFSINTQLICDAQLKIMAVDARWGGSVHDQTIFDNSAAKYEISRNPLFRTGYLVGDGGYGCQKYLLTPLVTRSVTTAAQKRYQLFVKLDLRYHILIEALAAYGIPQDFLLVLFLKW
jgi:nuclease HARBI1